VARFIGAPSINVLDGVVEGAVPSTHVKTKGGAITPINAGGHPGRHVSAAFRPEHVQIAERGAIEGKIDVIENLGHETYVFVDTADGRVCVIVDRAQRPRAGDAVRLAVSPSHMHLFDAETGVRLAS
jgi:multiple sugar transport system ATP-binding protein